MSALLPPNPIYYRGSKLNYDDHITVPETVQHFSQVYGPLAYRVCRSCGVLSHLMQFGWNRAKPQDFGKSRKCKRCTKLYARRYCNKNKEKTRAYHKAYRKSKRDCPIAQQARRAKSRAYYAANRDKRLAYQRAYAIRKVVEIRTRKENNRKYSADRRARKVGASGTCSPAKWREKLAYFGNKCRVCHNPDDIHQDHVIPLARGGTNWPANMQPLCKRCNSSKHAKPWREWRKVHL